VRRKVAIEPAAHFGGIATEAGEKVEVPLQLGAGSDRVGKIPHTIEVLLVLDEQHPVVSFHSRIAAAEPRC
jgi:hypothetical protein